MRWYSAERTWRWIFRDLPKRRRTGRRRTHREGRERSWWSTRRTSHQLELRGRRESGVARDPDIVSTAGESHRPGVDSGDALDLLRPGELSYICEGRRGGHT